MRRVQFRYETCVAAVNENNVVQYLGLDLNGTMMRRKNGEEAARVTCAYREDLRMPIARP